jgi:acylphosphatase
MIVTGLVQGVGFRDFAARAARRLQLTGAVRNLPDGRVEIVAEGERTGLLQLADQLRTGPPASQVDDVRVVWGPAGGRYPAFSVEF